MPHKPPRLRVCFVTGTRAEYGLMESTLRALRDHPAIELQIIATGQHLQASRGSTLREIRRAGWKIDATVPWSDDASPAGIARATGRATARLAELFASLRSDVVLVVGDRVEAFAAASAAHVSGLIVAHVHGGDRAQGQVDDAVRHAISKLAHVHFAATRASGERLFALGEDRFRIMVVGAPGIDGIHADAAPSRASQAGMPVPLKMPRKDAALVLLHPTDESARVERDRTRRLINACGRAFDDNIIALLPNSDPGSEGIAEILRRRAKAGDIALFTHLPRADFLRLMRDCRALIGNSSSGIIEAGSFGTPVLDIGPRQAGRDRGSNVTHVDWAGRSLEAAVRRIANQPRRPVTDNPYDRGGAGKKIAGALASLQIDARLRRKLIRY